MWPATELELKNAGIKDQMITQRDTLVAGCTDAASENKESEEELAEMSRRVRHIKGSGYNAWETTPQLSMWRAILRRH